jgi:hypothetical protein
MRHELKTEVRFFEAVQSGAKTFEIRRNDRGFSVGDELLLREWDPSSGTYTGRRCVKTITYKTDYMQRRGFVVLGLGQVQTKCTIVKCRKREALTNPFNPKLPPKFTRAVEILEFLAANPAWELSQWEGSTMNSGGWRVRKHDKAELMVIPCHANAARSAWASWKTHPANPRR